MDEKTLLSNGRGQNFSERYIAEQIINHKDDIIYLSGLVEGVAHQLIALRYLIDKSKSGTGKEWTDSYSERFHSLILSLKGSQRNLEQLRAYLDSIEKEVINSFQSQIVEGILQTKGKTVSYKKGE